jgi:carboxymethylenebutenolidase
MSEVDSLTRFPLARRGALMGALISGFTLATTRVDAQAIHTDANGLVAEETKIASDGAQLPAYFARPQGAGPFPIVLVQEEVFGVHEYIKDICRRLAHEGYMAVAIEYYARMGDLATMTDAGQIVRDVISKTPDAQIMRDLDASAAWAASHGGDPKRLGVTGFCQGGRNTWLYAEHNPNLKAAVAWYGTVNLETTEYKPVSPILAADQLKCPLLSLSGEKDPAAKPALLKQAAERARAAGHTVEMVLYPNAAHGFHADYRPSYRAADAADGWQRMLAWFRKYGVG